MQCHLYNYGWYVIVGYTIFKSHAGAPLKEVVQVPVVLFSAYAAALKEYEDDTNTDSEGEMMLL